MCVKVCCTNVPIPMQDKNRYTQVRITVYSKREEHFLRQACLLGITSSNDVIIVNGAV